MVVMDKVTEVMNRIKRVDFLPEDVKDQADIDAPLSIGYGVTNSQPYTVRLMLQWLDVHPGQNILDVGSGSGWTTALLSSLTGKTGQVTAVERIPELVDFGRENCKKLKLGNVQFLKAGKKFGYSQNAPYDRILVSAGASRIPEELAEQMKSGGKMVIPVDDSIFEVTKDEKGIISTVEHYGFAFVPLF